MSKKNQEINHSFYLFGRMTKILYSLGIQTVNKSYAKKFFKNWCRVDQNVYLVYQKNGFNVGFKTNYCGVNTFIPAVLKNHWVSDHHFLSMFYAFGPRYYSIIPYDNNLYHMKFNRIGIPNNLDEFDEFFKILKERYCLLDNLNTWVRLFDFNNDRRILNRQGLVYPEFNKFDKNLFNDSLQYYKSYNGFRHIADVRKKIINIFEHILASITIG